MRRVLIINESRVPHYRVGAYNYLSEYLKKRGFALTVAAEGIEGETLPDVEFDLRRISMTFKKLVMAIKTVDPAVIIFWVRLRNLYLFPTLITAKALKKAVIYWGHGYDLYGRNSYTKKFINNIQYWMSDALILYAEHLRKLVSKRFHDKIFIANNTIYFNGYRIEPEKKKYYLKKYNISTSKNIVCMGRMQKRKKIDHLIDAFRLLKNDDIGLIFVGADTDGVLGNVEDQRIYKFGPVYGIERLELLCASDVFCLPGAVGLSIVDAFYCGLPLVTENGAVSPEIMYLKDGVNGFIVPKDDIKELYEKIRVLLEDDEMRERFSGEARREIMMKGHIDNMCKGFLDAIQFACKKRFGVCC